MNKSSPAGILGNSHQNNFSFLRLFLASLVLLSHAPELVDGSRDREILTQLFGSISFGELAVDGFFLLSGYLIVKSWVSDPNILAFLTKRVLRIYPAFIVASLVGAIIIGPLGSVPSEYFSQFRIMSFLKGVVLLLPTATPPVFTGLHYPVVNGSMWTIRFEFMCYLLVLTAGFIGVLNRRWIWFFFTALSVQCFFLLKFQYFNLNGVNGLLTIQSLIRLSCFFLVGGCFYLFKDEIKFDPRKGLFAAIVLMIGMSSHAYAEIFLAVCGGYLLFYFAHAPIQKLQCFNMYPDISYGLYLYGWPIQKLLLWYWPGMSPWMLFLLSLIAGAASGMLSWEWVEKPCLKLKTSRLRVGNIVDTRAS